jgi:hypothetical protein
LTPAHLTPAQVLSRLHTRTFYPYIGEEIIPVAFYQQAQDKQEQAAAGKNFSTGSGSGGNLVLTASLIRILKEAK